MQIFEIDAEQRVLSEQEGVITVSPRNNSFMYQIKHSILMHAIAYGTRRVASSDTCSNDRRARDAKHEPAI